jgi:hypothetical protein
MLHVYSFPHSRFITIQIFSTPISTHFHLMHFRIASYIPRSSVQIQPLWILSSWHYYHDDDDDCDYANDNDKNDDDDNYNDDNDENTALCCNKSAHNQSHVIQDWWPFQSFSLIMVIQSVLLEDGQWCSVKCGHKQVLGNKDGTTVLL